MRSFGKTTLRERGLTVTEVAQGLGIARANLSAIVNERAGISPELAVKLSEAFGNTAQFWMNLQKNYELWHVERKVNRATIQHFGLSQTERQTAKVILNPFLSSLDYFIHLNTPYSSAEMERSQPNIELSFSPQG